MNTRVMTWAAWIAAVLMLTASGTASASSVFLVPNSCLGKNTLEGGLHRGSASVSAEACRGYSQAYSCDAAGLFVAPATNPNASRLYEVGLAKDLRRNPVTGTQVNHAPQSRQAESLIGDFNLRNKVGNEPSIRLPIEEHNAVSAAQRARTAPASARDLLADEIRILRQNTNAPNSALQDLIRLSRETHPWDYLPLHRMELP